LALASGDPDLFNPPASASKIILNFFITWAFGPSKGKDPN